MVEEGRLFVVISSGIHFVLAAISFFTTCYVARLQTEYVYEDDKWFNELWLMLDMDHDERYLTRRLEQAESGDHDDDDADDEDDDDYLVPTGMSATSLSDIVSIENEAMGEKFYPLKMVETEEIVVEVPESAIQEIFVHLEQDEIHKADDGKDSIFTLSNVLMTLQSSTLGKLTFPTDTKLRKDEDNPKLQHMKSTMERSATENVEGIHVKSKPVNIIKPLSGPVFKIEEQEPLITQTHDNPKLQQMKSTVEKSATENVEGIHMKNGEEHIHMSFTIEKALPEDIDLETIGKSGLEQISEKLGLGLMY